MKEKIIGILTDLRPEFDFSQAGVDFIDEGMLDSFDVVSLVAALNAEFNIEIGGEDVLPENFSSFETIENLVKKYV